jgi:hypothetical protein
MHAAQQFIEQKPIFMDIINNQYFHRELSKATAVISHVFLLGIYKNHVFEWLFASDGSAML